MDTKYTMDTPIKDIKVDKRIVNALYRYGIDTVGELVNKDITNVLAVRGIGQNSIEVLKNELANGGVEWDTTPRHGSCPREGEVNDTSPIALLGIDEKLYKKLKDNGYDTILQLCIQTITLL